MVGLFEMQWHVHGRDESLQLCTRGCVCVYVSVCVCVSQVINIDQHIHFSSIYYFQQRLLHHLKGPDHFHNCHVHLSVQCPTWCEAQADSRLGRSPTSQLEGGHNRDEPCRSTNTTLMGSAQGMQRAST